MTERLPIFAYHPDPIATGSIVASTDICECCNAARGYAYYTTPYGIEEISCVCPWCIADGSSHEKLGVEFVDSHPLSVAGVPREVIEEVSFRTPGYQSWQQDAWLACCGDACEFHGAAPAHDLRSLDAQRLMRLSSDSGFPEKDLPYIIEHYVPRGSPAFYKFLCRHCGVARYGGDLM